MEKVKWKMENVECQFERSREHGKEDENEKI